MLLLWSANLLQNQLFKKLFQKHRVSNGLVPDQGGHSVGPDLCPNCLQRLSAGDQSRCWQGKYER